MTPPSHPSAAHYLALCGGVGGAKLALGLSHALPPGNLTIVVNNGDDFDYLGLTICPDLDTVTYTLANLAHPLQGWGRDEESWAAHAVQKQLQVEPWFQLGDKDLGLHLARRAMLDAGHSLSAVTTAITRAFGIGHRVSPMTDDPVRTLVDTDLGPLPFQDYFVRQRCAPVVRGLRYLGADAAQAAPALLAALGDRQLGGVIICPSNPYLSIDPILALPGVRDALRRLSAPVIAVAPIVGGSAIKGPTAKIMRELGLDPSAQAVARHYGDLLDGYVIDAADWPAARESGANLSLLPADIVMRTLDDKIRLARCCLDFANALANQPTTGN
ncbi:MAG: 2-phospho-L-lactate transferase [Azonexus sp.]|nr:2-phospho-L-lactate transferase [Azonexus sp.]